MTKIRIKVFFVIASCVTAIEVNAASLLLESEINAQAAYDDNVLYSSTADDTSSAIITITPKAKLTYDSDHWETTANAYVSGTKYTEELQNQFDSYVDFGTAYKEDRGIYSIAASLNQHENRAEETNILGESIDQIDTRKFSIKPNYTYLVTERMSLSIAYDFSVVDYGTDTVDAYFSYKTQTGIGMLDYNLSQRSKLKLTLAAMDYASDNGASEYDVLSAKVGVTHKLSELVTGNFSVGVTDREFFDRSNQTFSFFGSTVTGVQELETSSSGSSYDASIDAGWVTVGASRDYVSNSLGGLNLTENISAKFRMQFSPLIGITLVLDRREINELNAYVPDNSQIDTRVVPEIKFNLAHNLSVSARYIKGEKEIVSTIRNDTIDYNKFYVSMRYIFPSI